MMRSSAVKAGFLRESTSIMLVAAPIGVRLAADAQVHRTPPARLGAHQQLDRIDAIDGGGTDIRCNVGDPARFGTSATGIPRWAGSRGGSQRRACGRTSAMART